MTQIVQQSGLTALDGFVFPAGATAIALDRAYRRIWASPHWRQLYPYTIVLQQTLRQVGGRAPARAAQIGALNAMLAKIAPGLPRLNPAGSQLRADALLIGECLRAAELNLMRRVLDGMSETGRSAIYISWSRQDEASMLAGVEARPGPALQVVHPLAGAPRLWIARWYTVALLKALRDWLRLVELVAPLGIAPSAGSLRSMFWAARAQLAWAAVAPQIEAGAAIVLHHIRPLSAVAALAFLDRGRPVTTFQQGVISLSSGYAPVVATRILCSGDHSAQLLAQLDRDYAAISGRPPTCRDYLPVGALLDTIISRGAAPAQHTLLIVDQMSTWSATLYGIGGQYQQLVAAVDAVARQVSDLDQIVIRLHPSNDQADVWEQLARRFPGRVRISASGTPFSQDLSTATLVAGLFSGGLISAAACGIPALLIWEPGWFSTPDLGAFADDSYVGVSSLSARVTSLLGNPDAYRHACIEAQRSAASYYTGLRSCEFTPELIARILSPQAPGAQIGAAS